MEINLKEIIDRIKAEKIAGAIAPAYVLKREIDREIIKIVNGELNKMAIEGKITVGETINDKYIL